MIRRLIVLIASSGLLVVSSFVNAADFGVKLTRPDSLEGWDYAAKPARGWTVEDGCFRGNAESSELLSGFTAGDCEIRFRWAVADKGRLSILMPQVPTGKGMRVVLSEGDQGIQVYDDDKQVFAGSMIVARNDGKSHSGAICRKDGKLSVTIDGEKRCEVPVDAGRRFGLGIRIEAGEATISDLRGAEPPGRRLIPEGANTLPEGEWMTDGKRECWGAENGDLTLKSGGGRYLRSTKEYGNFTLSFDFLMTKGINSGIGIRTPKGGWPSGDGMEIQLYDHPRDDEHSHMTIYGNVLPMARGYKPGEWNSYVIKADGYMIHVWENGELVQSANTRFHPELRHRRLKGWTGPQDHNACVRLRNFRILEAPDGTGLAEWAKAKRPSAARTMIERIMNSEAVSKRDGIRSFAIEKTIESDSPGEHVLADLKGPGSIVRIARDSDEGRLALYFDGEEKPRIECKPSELSSRVSRLSEQESPGVTSLHFAKSLKIVLRDAKDATYRFEGVRFPKDLPITTYSGPQTSFPRTLSAAPMYRQHVLQSIHRENDPAMRLKAAPESLAPGKRRTLAKLDGAGLVRFIKLLGNDKLLASDDLWLRVKIDGEDQPAISAPARFWFPAYATGKGRFKGFVFCLRRGPTILLGMPFGNGFELMAENRGESPLDGVGAEVSIERATAETKDDIQGRRRLRGRFVEAADSEQEDVLIEGAGRWVGLVWEAGENDTLSLQVDGATADGYSDVPADLFLGKHGEYRGVLSGRDGSLAWRYLLLAPVDFEKSLALKVKGEKAGRKLVLYLD